MVFYYLLREDDNFLNLYGYNFSYFKISASFFEHPVRSNKQHSFLM